MESFKIPLQVATETQNYLKGIFHCWIRLNYGHGFLTKEPLRKSFESMYADIKRSIESSSASNTPYAHFSILYSSQ